MHEIQIIWRHCQQMYPTSAEELAQIRQAPFFLAPFASFASFFGDDCLPMVGGLGLLGVEGASFLSSRADKAELPRALPATTAAARATPCVISLSKASIPASKSAQFSSGTSSLTSSSDSGVVNHSHFKASLAQGLFFSPRIKQHPHESLCRTRWSLPTDTSGFRHALEEASKA